MSADAIQNLRTNQKQLDADGIMVGVSRQALDEALAELDRLEKLVEEAREERGTLKNALADAEKILAQFSVDKTLHVSGGTEE